METPRHSPATTSWLQRSPLATSTSLCLRTCSRAASQGQAHRDLRSQGRSTAPPLALVGTLVGYLGTFLALLPLQIPELTLIMNTCACSWAPIPGERGGYQC